MLSSFPFDRKRWLLVLIDFCIVVVATKTTQWIILGRYYDIYSSATGASILTMALYMIMIYIFDLYNIRRPFINKRTAIRTALAVSTAGLFAIMIFYSMPQYKYGRGVFLVQMIMVWCLVFGWRCIFNLAFMNREVKRRVLVLGAGNAGAALYKLLNSHDTPYQIVGFLDDDIRKQGVAEGLPAVMGKTDQLVEIAAAEGINTAILAITHHRPPDLIRNILEARLKGINITDMPAVYEDLTGAIPIEHLRYDWLLNADGFNLLSKQLIRKVKRLIDFSVSGLLLAGTVPVMLLTAIAIRFDSPGPIFFKQKRVGQNERIFTIWKFRSMREDAEKSGAAWAGEEDPRITRVGRWIRKLRIDELPQIINVFRGEMSLIGPRPERPEFVHDLEREIPYYAVRHYVAPGITGWAQVKYRYGASIADSLKKLEYDIYYIKNMSLILDTRIMLKTIRVIFFGDGAR
ncbi:sugar transferase [Desulfococcaceae bacterium HSG9]|nr:sugar transferase [Desulfococcaceae bacterium HSG9]